MSGSWTNHSFELIIFSELVEPMSRWYEHVWTKHLNEGAKYKFLRFLIVYVKMWADEDKFIHFIWFRHVKQWSFTSQLGALKI